MAFNILIDSESIDTAMIVAANLSKSLGHTIAVYNYAIGHLFQPGTNYIVVGAPKNSTQYRMLCGDGFNPDHVFYVSTKFRSDHVDTLEIFYEGFLSSYVSTNTDQLLKYVSGDIRLNNSI
jgi:hypothetical protein